MTGFRLPRGGPVAWVWACVAIVLVIGAETPAHASYVKRYVTVANGGMTITGNALGLNRSSGSAIGVFTTVDTTQKVQNWPAGTTMTWANNSSAAPLDIPAGSTVLYAELIWAGSYKAMSGSSVAEDVTSSLGSTVTITGPMGSSAISPDPLTAQIANTASGSYFYTRSANVTSFVQSSGAGLYTVGHVPAAINNKDTSGLYAGWSIIVVYGNQSLPARNMTVFVGAEVTNSSLTTTSSISGFYTPSAGAPQGRLMVVAGEGDPDITGDKMTFGPTTATLGTVSGPNNPVSNFFASQINQDDGTRDTAGTFGTSNSTPGSFTYQARQGWDITNVDVSARLINSQSTAYVRGTTTGDAYMISALGLQINVGAPVFPTNVLTVDKATSYVGDTLTLTCVLNNSTGTADALNTTFTAALPAGTSYVAGSFKKVGVVVAGADPTTGVSLGVIAAGTSVTVTYQVRVNSVPLAPAAAQYSNTASWAYQYQSGPGLPLNNGTVTTNTVVTAIPRLDVVKAASPSGRVTPGGTVTYTMTVTNSGTAATAGATLVDPIPTGAVYVAGSTMLNSAVVADVGGTSYYATTRMVKSAGAVDGVIAVAATATVVYKVTIAPNPPATITNTVTVDPDGAGPMAAQAVSITSSPSLSDLGVTITNGQAQTVPGTTTTYTILVTNNGPDPATSLGLSVTAPAVLLNAVYTPAAGTYSAATGVWSGLSLASGQSVALTLAGLVSAAATGTLVVAATVSPASGTADTNAANNTASETDTLVPTADLSIAKTNGASSVQPGASVTYTISVTNLGPSSVSSVYVVDALPATLLTPTFVPSVGFYNSENGQWNGLTLGPNQTISMALTCTVQASATGTLTNGVTVTAPAGVTDPVVANNTGTDTDRVGFTRQVSGTVFSDLNHDAQMNGVDVPAGISGLFVKAVASGGTAALSAAAVDTATGAYVLTSVTNGTYSLVLDSNATLSDITPYVPAGWIGTEAPGQVRTGVVLGSSDLPGQDFGLFHGSTVAGRVFIDTGTGGGTANNAIRDGAEAGIPSVGLTLAAVSTGAVLDQAATAGDGAFKLWVPFSAVGGGLRVTETNALGYTSTGGQPGTTGGGYDRGADALTFTPATGLAYTGVDFADVPPSTLTPDNTLVGLPGGTVQFAHLFTAGTAGQVSIALAGQSTPTGLVWSSLVYRDANANGVVDPGEPQVTGPITVTAGQVVSLVIMQSVPVQAPTNAQNVLTVTATLAPANASPTISQTAVRVDTTVVSPGGGLVLTKTTSAASAVSGATLVYTVLYRNVGTQPIVNLVVNDSTPSYTTFLAASYGALPANLTGCTIIAPAVGASGPIRWTFQGSLAPNTGASVTFTVRVQ
ncbi:MAG: DUF11 domain-containing protein [Armatimonadetes bacterium]|nr:DUF11 domain-containing protein [Armatimonadota bacterium]